jgi:hypothetical protein
MTRWPLCLGGLALALGALVLPRSAGAATPWSVHIVQVHETAVPGPDGNGVVGPRLVVARFARPTVRGDLLVAAVVDGVDTSGMTQPRDELPGWTLGEDVIGGNRANGGSGPYDTGGLQAAIYFYPDNPGGIVSVPATRIAHSTRSDVTVLVAELSGAPALVALDTSGASTSGPTAATDTTRSAVATDHATRSAPELVLAAFNNGGNSPHGERISWSKGWTLIGEDTAQGNIDQPVLFDYEVLARPGVASQKMQYRGGYPIDNCAAILALR